MIILQCVSPMLENCICFYMCASRAVSMRLPFKHYYQQNSEQSSTGLEHMQAWCWYCVLTQSAISVNKQYLATYIVYSWHHGTTFLVTLVLMYMPAQNVHMYQRAQLCKSNQSNKPSINSQYWRLVSFQLMNLSQLIVPMLFSYLANFIPCQHFHI